MWRIILIFTLGHLVNEFLRKLVLALWKQIVNMSNKKATVEKENYHRTKYSMRPTKKANKQNRPNHRKKTNKQNPQKQDNIHLRTDKHNNHRFIN